MPAIYNSLLFPLGEIESAVESILEVTFLSSILGTGK